MSSDLSWDKFPFNSDLTQMLKASDNLLTSELKSDPKTELGLWVNFFSWLWKGIMVLNKGNAQCHPGYKHFLVHDAWKGLYCHISSLASLQLLIRLTPHQVQLSATLHKFDGHLCLHQLICPITKWQHCSFVHCKTSYAPNINISTYV